MLIQPTRCFLGSDLSRALETIGSAMFGAEQKESPQRLGAISSQQLDSQPVQQIMIETLLLKQIITQLLFCIAMVEGMRFIIQFVFFSTRMCKSTII